MKAVIEWSIKHWKWGIPILLLPLLILFRGFGWVWRLIGVSPPCPGPASPVHFNKEKAEAARESIKSAHETEAEKITAEAEALRDRVNEKFGGGS